MLGYVWIFVLYIVLCIIGIYAKQLVLTFPISSTTTIATVPSGNVKEKHWQKQIQELNTSPRKSDII